LKAIFPRYFQFDKQLEAESFEALAGNSWINKYYVDGRWWDVERGYIGLWEIFARRGLSEAAIKRELLDGGYTEEQINAIRAVKGVTAAQLTGSDSGSGGSGGSGGSKGSGGAKTGDNQTWTGPEGYQSGLIQQITIQRSRNIFLTSDEILTAIGNDQRALSERNRTARPIMYQVYLDGSTDAVSGQPLINQYIFDLAPNEINYSNFGGEWVSIERIGGFPYIDWKNFKLLQISIQFTIAVNFGNTNTGDGLQISAMEQIKKLQRMAQTPFPVMFYRFDELLTNQFRYDDSGTPRGIQFIIQDLSISATQRNENMEITRATANLTLQEIPIERTNLIGMPRLVHKKIKPDEPVPFTDPEYGLTSANLTSPPDRTVTYRN